jgi:cytochrome c oxidase subunit IV
MAELEQGEHHPGVGQYVEIGVILALLTTIEVGLYVFRERLTQPVIVGGLLFLTAVKFVLVAAFFMHLRFDTRLMRRLFVVGLLLAASIFAVVAVLSYSVHPVQEIALSAVQVLG